MKNDHITPLLPDLPGLVDSEQRRVVKMKEPYVSSSGFRLFLEGEDTCTLDPLQLHTLTSCGFNSSNPLIIITHGWSVRSTPAPLTLHWPEPLHTKHGTWSVQVISCTPAPLQTEAGTLRLGPDTDNSSTGLFSMTEPSSHWEVTDTELDCRGGNVIKSLKYTEIRKYHGYIQRYSEMSAAI